MSAREKLLNLLSSYSNPEAKLDAYRTEVLNKAADRLTNTNPDRSSDFSDGVEWAIDALLALVAEGGTR